MLSELQNRASSVSVLVPQRSFASITDVANELRDKGVLDEEECFIDATFAMGSTLFPRRPDVLQLHQKRKHSVRQVLQWLEMCLQLLPEQFGQVAVLCCLFVRRTRWTPLA
jgi:hypothetical protein